MPDQLLSPSDLTLDEIEKVLSRAALLKARTEPPRPSRLRVGALYYNPSLRTRVSFEQAAWILGGNCQTLNTSSESWKLSFDPQALMDGEEAENVVEAARVLGRYFHVLGVRAFPGGEAWSVERTEPIIRAFAQHAGVPVVSLEGAMHHPCQSLADLMTIRENFSEGVAGLPVALCWAWHPKALPMAVPHSFALQLSMAGADLTLVHPEGWQLDPELIAQLGPVKVSHDRRDGLQGQRLVYVKSWGRLDCYGDPAREQSLRAAHRDWIIDDPSAASRVMHCLPVRRNVVIAADVLDSDRSLVVDQAENRLWAQAGLLELLAQRMGLL